MQKVYAFLKKSETYYLATIDGNKPRVRPFGTVLIFENRLYFQTGKVKNVSKQLAANPHIEISAMADGKWIRIEAVAVEDDRREPREAMLDAYPTLKAMYKADDGNTQVFYLKNATATISSFTDPPEVITF
ncbi:MAG: pyridoxamine 5'-phosphate oxidase family protein [Spirochaetaceae bacterium]|jgi:uncharacterized pyridoxamine 5'-phosphate oxidase family protein|nr:pyridoxamine 5'-phosphate oxidase family protein [Spirochaetaceae bacterium]